MTEQGQEVIVLQNNKKETTDQEGDKNKYESKVDISNSNQEALDSKGNLKTSTLKNEQLVFNQKDIYELSSGAIENQIQKKTEGDYIKQDNNQNIFLPVIICKQNHQTCLICNTPPHINTLCDLKSTEYYDAAVEKLNFIKEIIAGKQ